MNRISRIDAHLAHLASLLIYVALAANDHAALASTGAQLSPNETKKEIEWSLRYSDLVVRGRVRFVMQSTERMAALYPGLENVNEEHATVRLLSINVEKVIKGACDQDLVILVPGLRGIPPCEPGESIVVAANYNPLIDRFVLRDYNGFFVEQDDVLLNQSKHSATNLQYDVSKVDEITRSVDLRSIFTQADYVGVGEAVSVDLSETTTGSTTTIKFRVQRTLSGPTLPDNIIVVSEETLRPRSAPTPTIHSGEVWYFALRKVGAKLEPVDGPNSLFRLENGNLKYNGRAPYSRDASSFEKAVTETRGRQ